MGTQGSQGRQGNKKPSGKTNFNGRAANGQSRPPMVDGEPVFTPEQLIAQARNRFPSFESGQFKLGRETIKPTLNQKKILHEIENKDVVFITGPLGSGKTLYPTYAAVKALIDGDIDSIALTAPAVEADEQLGFLKGNMNEKMHMHVIQILETIDELIGKKLREQLVAAEVIQIAPHAFNRGRTYKNTMYLLDECQNASGRQLMTSIGRLGHNSTFVFMGDDRQNDRTVGTSAYVAFMDRFNNEVYAREIGIVKLGTEDVRRHPLLSKIVERGDDRPLEGFENRQDSRRGSVVKLTPTPS